MKLLLASKSPRRRQLLSQLGYPVEFVDIDVDEHVPDGTPAADIAELLARRKASAYSVPSLREGCPEGAGWEIPTVLVAADTVVVLDDRPLGKPASRQQAIDMLRSLSGRHHSVYTGVCLRPLHSSNQAIKQSVPKLSPFQLWSATLWSQGGVPEGEGGLFLSFSERTNVFFRELSDTEIVHYVDTYHPFDKAGAYGIQEWIGMIGISRIDGCYYNVMGLPLAALYSHLRSLMAVN